MGYSPTTPTNSDVTATLSGSTDTGGSGIKTAGGSCTLSSNDQTCSVVISDNAGNTSSCTSSGVTNIDKTAPVFQNFTLASNNVKNSSYAKAGDKLTITLNISPADTWASGNNAEFIIGTGVVKNTGNYTFSDAPITSGNKNYTIETGDNGAFSFSGLVFSDAAGNKITGFTHGYQSSSNIIVDTVAPIIQFSDDVNSSSNSGDTIKISVSDANPDVNSYKYAFVNSGTCDSSIPLASFSDSFVADSAFIVSDTIHNGQFICVRAEDMAGNVSFQSSKNSLNINTPPTVSPKNWTLAENSPKETIVVSVNASDNESPNTLSYAIISGNDRNDFRIDGSGNIIQAGNLDYETTKKYTLEIQVTDTAGATATALVTIDITDIDEIAPTGTPSYSSTTWTNTGITLFLETSEKIVTPPDWTKIDDLHFSKSIGENFSGSLEIIDLAGNTGSVNLQVNNIDKTLPVCGTWTLSPTIPTTDKVTAVLTGSTDEGGSGLSSSSLTCDIITPGASCSISLHDIAGNTTQCTSPSAQNIDTEAPKVSLQGSGVVTLHVGDVFVDDGALWHDDLDGSGTILTAESGSVDTKNPGTYLLKYWYTDRSGRQSNIVNREIIVKNIEIIARDDSGTGSAGNTGSIDIIANDTFGNAPIDIQKYTLELTSTQTGFSLSSDGNITWQSDVLPGDYSLSYRICEKDFPTNCSQATVIISLSKGNIPVISLLGSSEVTIFAGQQYTDSGATAGDAEDGDITKRITLSGSVHVLKPGEYILEYRVADQSGNSATIERKVIVKPDLPPAVTLIGHENTEISLGENYVDSGALWSDEVDGTGSMFVGKWGEKNSFVFSGNIDPNKIGSYVGEYLKVDSFGNFSPLIRRTIIVKDTTLPETSILSGTVSSGAISNISIQKFAFQSSKEGSSFECKLDTADWVSCSADYTSPPLSDGTHTIQVRATDAFGNQDPTPAGIQFTIDTEKPIVTMSTPDTSISTGASFAVDFSGSDNVNISTYECQVNGESWQLCEPRFIAKPLHEGNNTLSIRATDTAGNISDIQSLNIIVSTPISDAEKFSATGGQMEAFVGDTLKNADIFAHISSNYRGSGEVEKEIILPLPTLDTPTTKNINARVRYPDGSTENVVVSIIIKSQSEKSINTPKGNDQTVFVGEVVDIEKSLMNAHVLENTPKFSWQKIPDTSQEGVIEAYIIVVYADSSSDIVPVKITVIKKNTTTENNTSNAVTGATTAALPPLPGITGPGGGSSTNNNTPIVINPPKTNTTPNPATPSVKPNGPTTEKLLPSQQSLTPQDTTPSGQQIFALDNRVTDYVCPKVVKVFNRSDIISRDISGSPFEDDMAALMMFRGLEKDEESFGQTYEEYKKWGVAINDGLFEPKRNVTRAEYVKMLVCSLSCRYTYLGTNTGFPDVSPNMWYAEYIKFAVDNNWINGYKDGNFRPNAPITRDEAAKILSNAIKLQTHTQTTTNFSDITKNSEFIPFIETLKDKGIMKGRTPTTFAPKAYIPRTEASRVIYRTFLGGGN